jgi:hypothetical protein
MTLTLTLTTAAYRCTLTTTPPTTKTGADTVAARVPPARFHRPFPCVHPHCSLTRGGLAVEEAQEWPGRSRRVHRVQPRVPGEHAARLLRVRDTLSHALCRAAPDRPPGRRVVVSTVHRGRPPRGRVRGVRRVGRARQHLPRRPPLPHVQEEGTGAGVVFAGSCILLSPLLHNHRHPVFPV